VVFNCPKTITESIQIYFRRLLSKCRKVKLKILLSTRRLNEMPEKHPADKYHKNNKGNYRAYEIYHYRIAYKITKTEIIITRVHHTKMEPKKY
jgi:mRNA-degrading endonuclease RelE of RelBE toxin-antitoxin system